MKRSQFVRFCLFCTRLLGTLCVCSLSQVSEFELSMGHFCTYAFVNMLLFLLGNNYPGMESVCHKVDVDLALKNLLKRIFQREFFKALKNLLKSFQRVFQSD